MPRPVENQADHQLMEMNLDIKKCLKTGSTDKVHRWLFKQTLCWRPHNPFVRAFLQNKRDKLSKLAKGLEDLEKMQLWQVVLRHWKNAGEKLVSKLYGQALPQGALLLDADDRSLPLVHFFTEAVLNLQKFTLLSCSRNSLSILGKSSIIPSVSLRLSRPLSMALFLGS